MEIWSDKYQGLGDVMRTLVHCLQRSLELKEPVGYHFSSDESKRNANTILFLLDSRGSVVLTEEPANQILDVNQGGFVIPSKIRWEGNLESRQIVYQFDGLSWGDRKNPPEEEVRWFLQLMAVNGYNMVKLGKHLGIEGSMVEASKARMFVGSDSGIAHLCYAVGTPVFILRYNQFPGLLKNWHKHRAVAFPSDLYKFADLFFIDGPVPVATFVRSYTASGFSMYHDPGSTETYTRGYRKFLEDFMREKGVHSVLDYGCGDWSFSKLISWGDVSYYGVDEVIPVVDRLKREFEGPKRVFQSTYLNDYKLPEGLDLVVIKDVAQHISNAEVVFLIEKFKGVKYVMWVNDKDEQEIAENRDVDRGSHRKLDMSKPPFSLKGEIAYSFKENGEIDGHCKGDNKVVFLQTNE